MKQEQETEIAQKELTFKEFFYVLKNYKWSILFITITLVSLSYTYVYFKPSKYEAYAIIKVKPIKKVKTDELINNYNNVISYTDVKQEISVLKTFQVNQQSLRRINLKVQYFKEERYKDIEISKETPIKIYAIRNISKEIIGKKLTLTPVDDGFSIQYVSSYKEKLKHKLFNSKIFEFKNSKKFHFGEVIKTKHFKFVVEKKANFDSPLKFIINGEERDIFENLVKSKLNISQLEKDTSLIKISYQDTIAERAKIYVDELTNSFINHSIANKNEHNTKALKFIVKELKALKQELNTSEEQLERYQVSKTILKPSAQAKDLIQQLNDIEIKLSENILKNKLILNLITFVQNNSNLDSIAPSLSKLKDPSTLRLIEKLQANQLKEEELTLEYTDEYPKLKALHKRIRKIREKIELNLKSLKMNITYQNKNLNSRKIQYEQQLKSLPSQERHLINIKRNYEVKSRMYENLLQRQQENKIIQFATFSDYQIIDQAYTSNRAIKIKLPFFMMLSSILGLFLGSILAFIRYYFNKKIQNQQDIKKLTSLPIYGTIPFYKQKKFSLKVNTEAKSPFTEGFRTLRTNLQFLKKPKQEATTILISSTIAGEGKSTISANLATIFEKAKYKTLVINLDIRKPTLHKFFAINSSIGISNYLGSTRYEIEDIILNTEFANLDIITSGTIPEDPSELILSKRLPPLFEKLKSIYEYIIIDTAPIGIVTDTKNLMQYSDLNLIILREDYAEKNFILTLEKMIEKHQFKNVGLLLNASKEKGGEYGYGYGYEYEQ